MAGSDTTGVDAALARVQHKIDGLQQRKFKVSRADAETLADELLKDGVENGKVVALSRLQQKLEYHNVPLPSVTIEYQNLTVTTQAIVGMSSVPTVGNATTSIIKRLTFQKLYPTTELRILNNLKGVLRPARPTLLLGPPGSGKSTYMKLLGGRLLPGPNLQIDGSVTYNGATRHEFTLPRTAAYVDQYDNHVPNLTVWETLEFAHACFTGSRKPVFDPAEAILQSKKESITSKGKDSRTVQEYLRRVEDLPAGQKQLAEIDGDEEAFEDLLARGWTTEARTEFVIRMLGLARCKDTLVGDAMIRGISGGERKRVTTAELIIGEARVLLLDEISTGLDSATVYATVQYHCQIAAALKLTTVIALLQPPPEVYHLFDDVILMSEGSVVYHGPVGDAVSFFNTTGFVCPPRKDVVSYLQEILTPVGQQHFADDDLRDEAMKRGLMGKTDQMLLPMDELSDLFWTQNRHGLATVQQLTEAPFEKGKGHPDALLRSTYALTFFQQLALVTRRQFKLLLRDKATLRGRMMQCVVMGLIVGSLFYNTGTTEEDAITLFGLSFLSCLFMVYGSFPQLAALLNQKGTWFKHRDTYFYHGLPFSFAQMLAQIPVSFLESFLYGIIIYFMAGFAESAKNYFIFWLTLASVSMAVSSIFRVFGATAPNAVAANSSVSILFLLLVATSGFAIIHRDIPKWMVWAYWISPLSYAIRALAVNEMTSHKWSHMAPGGGRTQGAAALEKFDFFKEEWWIYVGWAFLLGSFVVLSTITGFAFQYTVAEAQRARVPDPEQLKLAREAAKKRKKQLLKQVAGRSQSAKGGQLLKSISSGKLLELVKSRSQKKNGVTNGPSAPQTPKSHADPEALAGMQLDMAPSLEDPDLVQNALKEVQDKLPFSPITLVFRNLRYFVPNPRYSLQMKAYKAAMKEEKGGADVEANKPLVTEPSPTLELLKGVTGYAQPGVLTALMGGSGAGKTTLMDVIAGRKTVGRIEGEIFVNGHPKDQASWSRIVGYVEQFDIHTPAQTVQEALLFSARLRLDGSVPDEVVKLYVEECMEVVDMASLQFSLVGVPGSSAGLTTEQRKRLTIAVELVANPSVVFMDEPTSGLDARAASIVMRTVRNVAHNGRTVIVTIHQPSIEIFEAFDNLLLLHLGGNLIYFGPLGVHSRQLVNYLEAIPGVHPIHESSNPATWMLEVTGGSQALTAAKAEADFVGAWKNSPEMTHVKEEADRLVAEGAAHHKPVTYATAFAQTPAAQLRILCDKFTKAMWRDPSYNFIRLSRTLLVGLIFGAIYWQKGHLPSDNVQVGDVQNVMGLLFVTTNFLGMTNAISAMPVVGAERVVFYRERAASFYGTMAYAAAIGLTELPYLLGQAILFVPANYFMVGFKHSVANFFFYFCIFLENIAMYTFFGQFLVFTTPSQMIAQVVAAGLNFLFNIFNGFVIAYSQMPEGWRWMNRIVPTTWTLYGLASNQLGESKEPVSLGGRNYIVKSFLESYYNYVHSDHYYTILILLAYILFFRFTSMFALKYAKFLKR